MVVVRHDNESVAIHLVERKYPILLMCAFLHVEEGKLQGDGHD